MKLLAMDEKHAIRAAVHALSQGGVIAFPTETTYGLGCDPRKAKAVARIFRIKGRSKNKALLLVASCMADVQKVATPSPFSKRLASRYWPGALTMVLPSKKSARLAVPVHPRGQVAVRVSSSSFVRTLVKAYGFPIIATSANRSGSPDARSGRAVMRAFQYERQQPDLVIDAGSLPRRKPSTLIRVTTKGEIEVLRQGAVRMPKRFA